MSNADEIYEVIIGNRRYFSVKIGETELSVRIPLHVWESGNVTLLEEYADELISKVMKERMRIGAWSSRCLKIENQQTTN